MLLPVNFVLSAASATAGASNTGAAVAAVADSCFRGSLCTRTFFSDCFHFEFVFVFKNLMLQSYPDVEGYLLQFAGVDL